MAALKWAGFIARQTLFAQHHVNIDTLGQKQGSTLAKLVYIKTRRQNMVLKSIMLMSFTNLGGSLYSEPELGAAVFKSSLFGKARFSTMSYLCEID